jgi:hypothetical protein
LSSRSKFVVLSMKGLTLEFSRSMEGLTLDSRSEFVVLSMKGLTLDFQIYGGFDTCSRSEGLTLVFQIQVYCSIYEGFDTCIQI